MNKEDIVKLIDGDVFYHYKYCDFLYSKLEEKDNIINKLDKFISKVLEVYNNIDVKTLLIIKDKLKELKENGNNE